MQSWDISTSLGIILVFGFIGILLFAAGFRFVIQRRQLLSGREIGHFSVRKKDGKFVFDHPITITTEGKWCRLLLTFKSKMAYEFSLRWKHFFRRVTLATGTSYTLTISDGSRRVLYRDEGKLSRFLAFVGARGGDSQTLFSYRGSESQEGSITFLEFLPRHRPGYIVFSWRSNHGWKTRPQGLRPIGR